MASVRATEIKKGMALVFDGQIFIVTKHDHHTPGNLRAIHHVYMRHMKTGVQKYQRFGSGDSVEVAYLDLKAAQYLYKDSTGYVFMDEESYDQFPLPEDVVGELMSFIKPNQTVNVTFHEGTPVTVDLGPAVVLEVTETEDAIRGNTATNVTKNATLETGLVVRVPQHIKVGDKVKINTDDQSFLGRVN
jgi:elongation factor P